MLKQETVFENKTYKILRDFETQTDFQILTWKLDLVIINKKNATTGCIVDFAVLADHTVKIKESEKEDLDLAINFKNFGTWKRRWYHLKLVHLERSPKPWKGYWKSEDKSKQSKPQHF